MSSYRCELAWTGEPARARRPDRSGGRADRPGDARCRARARRRPARRPGDPGLRERPLARVPAGAARAGPGRAGELLDLARADVRGSPRRSTPRATGAWRRATFAEMALAGITTVGEFHYLHHGPGGTPYSDPNAIGRALIAAAVDAGVRITLIDACYLHGGIGAEPEGAQRRFADADADAWAERVSGSRRATGCGSAPRSTASARWTRNPRRSSRAGPASASSRCTPTSPSNRPRTRPAPSAYGASPAAVLAEAGALDERFTAVHATHLADTDFALLGEATRDLLPLPDDRARPGRRRRPGPPARRRRRRARPGNRLERDRRHVRGGARGGARRAARERRARPPLGGGAAAGGDGGTGTRCLGWPEAGRIEPGALCDLVAVDLDGVRLAGTDRARSRPGRWSSPATAADVREVIVGGRQVVGDGRHLTVDVARRASGAIAMSALVIDDIGLLVTNDPELGEGPLGIVRDAALVLEGERIVAAIEPAGAAGDERLDAGGRCVIPGFVDSHTHLVSPATGRTSSRRGWPGAPTRPAGSARPRPRRAPPATRSCARSTERRRAEGLRAGITHLEIKSRLRARRRDRAPALRDRGRVHRRRHLPRRPRRPGRVRGPRRRLRRARLRRDARRLRAARPLDRRLLRARRVRRRPVPGRARGGTASRARAARARQPARARTRGEARRRAGRGVGRPLHLPRGRRHRGAGGQRDGRHLPAGHGLLDPPAVPGRAPCDRRRGEASRSPPTRTRAPATPPRWGSASRSPSATWG